MPPPIPSPDKQQAILAAARDVPDKTFDLALVLGGTVSAGAYTAGTLDLLVQALDAFQAWPKKKHDVSLRLAAGSSGGAVCAAILGILLNRPFDHVSGTQAALNADGAGPANNMLWNVWVDTLTFLPMLDTDDLATAIQDPPPAPGAPAPAVQHVPALLNPGPIDTAVRLVVGYANQLGPYVQRLWAASPFRVATTVCNLCGVPFSIAGTPAIGVFNGASYVEHDDYAWFTLPNTADGSDSAPGQSLANAFALSAKPRDGVTFPYQVLGDYARASGSMPIGLPARPLSRPAEHYLYRPAARVGDDGSVIVDWPAPDWSQLPDVLASDPPVYGFTGVDGGTLNNDPVKVAHDALTGVGRHNPQSAAGANRAMLLIDPLTDQASPLPPVGASLVAAAKALVGTFVGGARYLTSDLALFQNNDVFSRFQLVPSRTDFTGAGMPMDAAPTDKDGNPLVGEAALAGSDFGALLGWCAREFRVHDFLLGRMNMAAYLRRELILRADNPLFSGWMDDDIRDYALTKDGNRAAVGEVVDKTAIYLPVIPMPPDNFGVFLPAWPVGALDPSNLKAPLTQRIEALLGHLREDNLQGFWGWLAQLVALGSVAGSVADELVTGLSATLKTRGLLS